MKQVGTFPLLHMILRLPCTWLFATCGSSDSIFFLSYLLTFQSSVIVSIIFVKAMMPHNMPLSEKRLTLPLRCVCTKRHLMRGWIPSNVRCAGAPSGYYSEVYYCPHPSILITDLQQLTNQCLYSSGDQFASETRIAPSISPKSSTTSSMSCKCYQTEAIAQSILASHPVLIFHSRTARQPLFQVLIIFLEFLRYLVKSLYVSVWISGPHLKANLLLHDWKRCNLCTREFWLPLATRRSPYGLSKFTLKPIFHPSMEVQVSVRPLLRK